MSMKRRTKEEIKEAENAKHRTNGIGCIILPIKDIVYAKQFFGSHNVTLVKCRPDDIDDNWYTLVPPIGTTSIIVDKDRDIYEIKLLDGHTFYYIPPAFERRERKYTREPEVLFEYRIINTRCDDISNHCIEE